MWHPISPANTLRRLPGGGSRTISTTVLSAKVALTPLQDGHIERWCVAMSQLTMGPGDIANTGTVDSEFCPVEHVASLHACMQDWGVPSGEDPPVALVCLGAGFHHDADSYADYGFCVLWLSEDIGWDLVFPQTGTRIALEYGTVALFDSGLLHGVVRRGASQYDADAFLADTAGLFLSQDFPMASQARKRLGVSKFSSRGVRNHTMLGADGIQEDIDLETGRWFARDLNRRR